MCGGFTLRLNPEKFLRVKEPGRYGKFQPYFNARPGEMLPIVTEEQPEQLTFALWNYLPHWASAGKMKNVINARSESLLEKPYFRGAITNHRCLIPADGFYEWQKIGTRRQPHFFHRRDNKPFVLAGVYDERPDDQQTLGFAIVTTTPNAVVARIHDRMPVILTDDMIEGWLSATTPMSDLPAYMRPYDARAMESYPVSAMVNSVHNKGPEVMERATLI